MTDEGCRCMCILSIGTRLSKHDGLLCASTIADASHSVSVAAHIVLLAHLSQCLNFCRRCRTLQTMSLDWVNHAYRIRSSALINALRYPVSPERHVTIRVLGKVVECSSIGSGAFPYIETRSIQQDNHCFDIIERCRESRDERFHCPVTGSTSERLRLNVRLNDGSIDTWYEEWRHKASHQAHED